MSAFTKSLNFSSNNLGKEVTLLFTFDDIASNPKLWHDQVPVCWNATTFGATGPYGVDLVYKNQLSVIRPQVNGGKITGATTFKDINVGQTTTLTVGAADVPLFSDTVPEANLLSAGMFKAINATKKKQDLAVGFHPEGHKFPTAALYFKDVGDTSNVTAQFTPVLRVYVTSDYKSTAIISGEITSPLVWSKNLATLGDSSSWVLTSDEAGVYHINEDKNA